MSYVKSTGTVIYRSKMGHGANKKNFHTFSALEFIAAITQHFPERMSQMVRYLGWYSNRMRGDRLKAEKAAVEGAAENTETASEIIIVSGFKTKKVPPLMWRECTKKIWEVDPLLCPHCGSLMKIGSFIYERKVIKKILVHLGLFKVEERKPNRAPLVLMGQSIGTTIEQYDDG